MNCRIISVENPTAMKGINPDCTDYRHSKFVKRRQYVEKVLLPQIRRLMPAEIFPAVTDEMFTANSGVVTYGDIQLKVRAGNTGNFLSHLMLWRKAEPILVLEDDALLPVENEANVMYAIEKFAEFQRGAVLHLLSAMPWSEHGRKEFRDFLPAFGNLKLTSTSDLSGTAAYCVNPQGAFDLVKAALRDGTLPTDGFIHRAFERSEIEVLVPKEYQRGFMLFEHFADWNHTHSPAEGAE